MNLKILHITDFHYRHNSRLFYSTARKINNGLIRNNFYVNEISEKELYNKYFFFSNKINNNILQSVINLNPDLIIIGHCSRINFETFRKIKELKKNIKIIQWFIDSLTSAGPDYDHNVKTFLKYSQFLDQSFITTDVETVEINKRFKRKINFIPNPCDASIDNLKIDKVPHPLYDLFFAMSHGQHRGVLKKSYKDSRETFIKKIIKKNTNLIYDFYGLDNLNPIWGNDFFNRLSQSKMALNLSRGKTVKYYSSDRISSLISNGITTFIDIKTELKKFFNNNEVIFYKNINDLSESLIYLKNNDKKRREIGRNGRLKYTKYYNSTLISLYMIEKTFGLKFSKNYSWI
jgi:spore maturation protein CgeB